MHVVPLTVPGMGRAIVLFLPKPVHLNSITEVEVDGHIYKQPWLKSDFTRSVRFLFFFNFSHFILRKDLS